ncbi:Vps52 / Sac2 family protein [Tieghemostelium lacteum]|uniref:Vps52 / Sac2 family protein n=1 Tax=Tieghemostelium lacteum TaxID=361077 RepID=A0A151ZD82_TIELA|nr:Vps52 / Sac2 family protein [Tieghemostelium lacteum]|eukprot:KYQ91913.1 Vps52 / Sac2 family protein [Tieghemostelium lacteum]
MFAKHINNKNMFFNKPKNDKPPPIMKQSSKLLLEKLKKDKTEIDIVNEDLDIVNILGYDFDDDSISLKDQETIKDALVKGYDLKQYSKEVEENINQLDKAVINDYFQERENYLTLYTQIQAVDTVLSDLEVMLNNYYSDLKNVGSEMNTIQEKSLSMSHKLNNRKQINEKLSKFISDVTISPEFSVYLLKSEINQDYIKKLQKLDVKITIFDEYKLIAPTLCTSNEPQLSKLTVDSIIKIREFLADNLNSGFKKLSEKRQKQAKLAPMGYLFQFLFKYSSYTASEVLKSFVENAEKYYSTYYKNYISALLKMQDDNTGKNDFLGAQTSKLKSLFTSGTSNNNGSPSKNSSQVNLKISNSTLSLLGHRTDIISTEAMESPPIDVPITVGLLESGIVQLTNITNQTNPNVPQVKYPFEQIYRSILYFLMDVVTSETLFIRDFFLGGEDVSLTIFAKCQTLLQTNTTQCLSQTSDLVSIALILCIIVRYKAVMFDRGIQVLNQTMDQIFNITLQRFLSVFSSNVKAITIKDLQPVSATAPHLIIRKYTDLLVVLLNTLSYSVKYNYTSDIEHVQSLVKKVVGEITSNTDKILKEVDTPSQSMLLINTYGSVLQTLQEYYNLIELNSTATLSNSKSTSPLLQSTSSVNTTESVTTRIILSFKTQFNNSVNKYVYDQLHGLKYLSGFIHFVQEWGPLVESNVKISEKDNPQYCSDNVSKILQSFDQNWTSAIATIRDSSLKHFSLCTYASNRTYDALLTQIYDCYRLLMIIINNSFPSIKSLPFYKGDQIIVKINEMNTTLNLSLVNNPKPEQQQDKK